MTRPSYRRHRSLKRLLLPGALALVIAACDSPETPVAEEEAPVRGLVTTIVQSAENSTLRRYPGVLEPSEITNLSFNVGGKLGKIDLNVGQSIAKGDVLAKLDVKQYETQVESAAAAVREAQAQFKQDSEDLERAERLLSSGTITRVARDEARTDFQVSKARLEQARKDLQSAREDLDDTILTAPFDGIINSVEVDSFATVTTATTVASLYNESSFEVSFSVNFDTVNRLVVGTPAKVRLADDPGVVLASVVSELGDRADTVSSFPVVVQLTEYNPIIKSGMAVEVAFEFRLPTERGFLIPLTAAIKEGQVPEGAGPNSVTPIGMYVFDPATSTVKRRVVTMGGIRENKFLIINGLEEGERVATAGVSFLRDGMTVKLLSEED